MIDIDCYKNNEPSLYIAVCYYYRFSIGPWHVGILRWIISNCCLFMRVPMMFFWLKTWFYFVLKSAESLIGVRESDWFAAHPHCTCTHIQKADCLCAMYECPRKRSHIQASNSNCMHKDLGISNIWLLQQLHWRKFYQCSVVSTYISIYICFLIIKLQRLSKAIIIT